MHFNIYLDDETGAHLNELAKASGETRNALIRQAIAEWMARRTQPGWPKEILEFNGIGDMPPFERYRDELLALKDDPLA